MTTPVAADTYTTPTGARLAVTSGQVQKVIPPATDPDADPEADDDDDEAVSDKFKTAKKPVSIQNKLKAFKAKLHAQNALLVEVKEALELANNRLQKNREEVKNEIKSEFTPEGS